MIRIDWALRLIWFAIGGFVVGTFAAVGPGLMGWDAFAAHVRGDVPPPPRLTAQEVQACVSK